MGTPFLVDMQCKEEIICEGNYELQRENSQEAVVDLWCRGVDLLMCCEIFRDEGLVDRNTSEV